jgi:2-hydroxy-3-keto-5-methylthiopentenyl-1-phosphate phosphatase
MILSDNFDYLLNSIFKNNGISNLDILSNRLRLSNNRLMPRFPYANKRCGDCAHCKKTSLLRVKPKNSQAVYVGDGLSDVCAAKYADVIFAKEYLNKRLRRDKVNCIPINNLKKVYDYFKKMPENGGNLSNGSKAKNHK